MSGTGKEKPPGAGIACPPKAEAAGAVFGTAAETPAGDGIGDALNPDLAAAVGALSTAPWFGIANPPCAGGSVNPPTALNPARENPGRDAPAPPVVGIAKPAELAGAAFFTWLEMVPGFETLKEEKPGRAMIFGADFGVEADVPDGPA